MTAKTQQTQRPRGEAASIVDARTATFGDPHHAYCPGDTDCVCLIIAAVLLDDLTCPGHGDTWRLNLELIGARKYAQGYADGVASCG